MIFFLFSEICTQWLRTSRSFLPVQFGGFDVAQTIGIVRRKEKDIGCHELIVLHSNNVANLCENNRVRNQSFVRHWKIRSDHHSPELDAIFPPPNNLFEGPWTFDYWLGCPSDVVAAEKEDKDHKGPPWWKLPRPCTKKTLVITKRLSKTENTKRGEDNSNVPHRRRHP